MNAYVLVALILLLGFALGRALRRIGLTEIVAYLLAGIIIGQVLGFSAPAQFSPAITGSTLALVAYMIGLNFSYPFLRRLGRQIVIILFVQVAATFAAVLGFVYLLTRNLPLSLITASVAPATAPAGTMAVLRDAKAKGTLTDIATALVGLDDALVIIVFSVGLMLTNIALGTEPSLTYFFTHPVWEILGGLGLGGAIGAATAYLTRKIHLSSDHLYLISIAIAILCWGVAEMIGVSAILACMALGTALINLNLHVGNRSHDLVDNIMTPVFVLFFAAVGMEVDFSLFHLIWPLVIVYTVARSLGKVAGCSIGGVLSRSEPKVKKYLGLAMLDQAGVAMGLAFLAVQAFPGTELGGQIITLLATTTVIHGLFSPPLIEYAVRKAGEAGP